jgi:magnesium/cobalt transport protein CorA
MMEGLHIEQGGVTPWSTDGEIPEGGLLWIDCVRGTDTDWPQLLQHLNGTVIHERHLHDSLNEGHASFFDFTSDYDMIIFRGMESGDFAEGFRTLPISFFISDRVLVTVQSGSSRSIDAVRQRMTLRSQRMPTEINALLHLILNTMVDRLLSVREPLIAQMERLTDELLSDQRSSDDWQGLLQHRRRLRQLEILCEEQEDAILAWRDSEPNDLSEPLRVRFTDLLEHIRRMTKFAQQQQHELDSVLQLHFSAVSHRTNAIMRTLTLLSAIFLPLTLIAGIYGMNFENMPELHSAHGYFLTLGGMGLLALVLLTLFRIKRWW